jgi:ABC-type antimicrobial peptide transport system permease subunit
VSPQRIGLALVGTFAVATLAIACIGVYGVVSFWVAVRQREIGIRIALGASARQVTALVAGQTAKLVVIGAVLGVAGGIAAGQAASAQLFQTPSTAPQARVGVALVLVVVALVASYVPARRALGVDAVKVLRTE